MAGIGAVNISHAAASTQPNQAGTQARDSSGSTGSNQNAAISQIASQNAGRQAADDDKYRAVQTPKQAEAGFSANQDEEHKDDAANAGGPQPKKAGPPSDTSRKLNVTA